MTSAGMILQQDFANAAARAKLALSTQRAVVRLLPPTRELIMGQVGSALERLNTIEIGDVLERVWLTSRTLIQAAHRSQNSGRPEAVHFNGYSVPVDYEQKLEVYVGTPRPVATVPFGLQLILELLNFDGVVERGRLVRLSCETFTVTAALTVARQVFAPHKVRLNLDLELPLPAGGFRLA